MYQYILGIFDIRVKTFLTKRLPKGRSAFFILIFLTVLCFNAKAQDFFPQEPAWGIRIGTDYELPGKNLADYYRANINYNAGFMKFYDRYTFEAVISYRKFGAYHGVRYDHTDPANTVTTIVSPYQTFLFYISATYNLLEADGVNVYGGVNIGSGFSKSGLGYYDNYNNITSTSTQKQGYLAPKIGFTYALKNGLNIDGRISYNLYTTGGDYTYNSRTGTIGNSGTLATSLSAGVGLLYKF